MELDWLYNDPAQACVLLLQVRQSAGLLLKNNLKAQYAATTEEFRQYIKVGYCCMFLLKATVSSPYLLDTATGYVELPSLMGCPSQQSRCVLIMSCIFCMAALILAFC